MNKKTKTQEFYTSPRAEVIEMKIRRVICQSNTERPEDVTPEWSWVEE